MHNQITSVILSIAALWLAVGCATDPKADWERSGACFEQIKAGKQEKLISDAKRMIRQDRWNADAYACLAMAYYRNGNTEFALKSLKVAEDTLPKEVIDSIHDKIWTYRPELLAEKEYKDFYALSGGDCILRNVTALEGNGSLILGYFYNPEVNKRIRHIRAKKYISGTEQCTEIDKVCPKCTIQEAEAIIKIKDYRITDIQKLISSRPIERNVRYIEKILELERNK